jgi:NADPH-dependent 2,4-dienoyl-CoA reductase/sulfur reductase-like enzyme
VPFGWVLLIDIINPIRSIDLGSPLILNGRTAEIPHVAIVGAGFGGLEAAKALAWAPVRVTVIDRGTRPLMCGFLLASDRICRGKRREIASGARAMQPKFKKGLRNSNTIRLPVRQ